MSVGYVKFASCTTSSIAGAAGNDPVANAPIAEFGSLLDVTYPNVFESGQVACFINSNQYEIEHQIQT